MADRNGRTRTWRVRWTAIALAMGLGAAGAAWLAADDEAADGSRAPSLRSQPAGEPTGELHPPIYAGSWQGDVPRPAPQASPSPLVRRSSLIPTPPAESQEEPRVETPTPVLATLPAPAKHGPVAAAPPSAATPDPLDAPGFASLPTTVVATRRRPARRLETGTAGPVALAVAPESIASDAPPRVADTAPTATPIAPSVGAAEPRPEPRPLSVLDDALERMPYPKLDRLEPAELDAVRGTAVKPVAPVSRPPVSSHRVVALDEQLPVLRAIPPIAEDVGPKPLLPAPRPALGDDIVFEAPPRGEKPGTSVVALAVTADPIHKPLPPVLVHPVETRDAPTAGLPEQAQGHGLGLGLSLKSISLDEEGIGSPPLLRAMSTAVPEPGTALLMAAGLAGLGIAGRRR